MKNLVKAAFHLVADWSCFEKFKAFAQKGTDRFRFPEDSETRLFTFEES